MYVDGRDLADAFVLAARAPDLDGFEAFYVATGRMMTASPKRWLQQHLPHLDHLTTELGEDDDLLSYAKATRLLGYRPSHVWPRERWEPDLRRRQQSESESKGQQGQGQGQGQG
jgi:nucleoside-diphosphate-sugar epimerase